MSLGEVCIMMTYEYSENVSLTHSIKFITTSLLKYSFSVPPGNIAIEFIQCLIRDKETSLHREMSQGCPNCILN